VNPPPLLPPDFAAIPDELKERPQWVLWQAKWQPDKGKYDKPPINARTGGNAQSNNPATWAPFPVATAAFEQGAGKYAGVGYVPSDEDPYTGIDLDDCITEAGKVASWAASWIALLDSYTERSPSGRGLRVFTRAVLPVTGGKRGPVEMYRTLHYLTVTGRHLPGTPATINARQESVEAMYRAVFTPASAKAEATPPSFARAEGLPSDDTDLLALAFQAKNGEKIRALYAGNWQAEYTSQSEADLALCALLAFYTGPDPARLDRLFRTSGLYRDKWDDVHFSGGETHGQRCVHKALAGCAEFYRPPGERAAGKEARGSMGGSAAERDWPEPLAEAAYQGLAGAFVRAVEPHTESDPVAVLAQVLVCFGNVIGRGAFFKVGASHHRGNLFACLVGRTGGGRKGSSWDETAALFAAVAPDWTEGRIKSGVSSGEGFIYAVRDGREPGDDDKRMLAVETEFSNVLRAMERDGNTISARIRNAWDGTALETLVKRDPLKATDAHISIIGHITPEELRRYLTRTETDNGFANRFLWLCTKRSKHLPDGGDFTDRDRAPFVEQLRQAVTFASAAGEITRTEEAREIWHALYPNLNHEVPGLFGAITSRGAPQVLRLSLLFALLDCSRVVRDDHLLAALALWEYARHSAAYIFGDALGDPVADAILRGLRSAGAGGLTRTDISGLLGRNQKADRIEEALRLLVAVGSARSETRPTGGHDAEVWFAAGRTK